MENYHALLIAKRDEILHHSHQREDIWIVPCNELVETQQLAGERDFAVRALERKARTLTQIDAALQRIADGEFGTCIECEEPISPKRLAAVPWAPYCLRCQESRDTRHEPDPFTPTLAA